ncbi:ABC transporter substrate-binding protein [Clostridium sp. P21]|uniref:ABC transporter substrate-binding protein n=1 Tax=Clostridium muellerianum TaxID=2716538 RepID=A0A7Y0EIC1_9CLOT|nr:ABC transporter substrate-binding protein [Clostridium muellerianum]NMM64009.1 ABC transporter substrate-binding protein [Clostridium muellerianum]
MKKAILKVISIISISAMFFSGCGTTAASQANNKGEKVKIEYWHVNAETQGGKSVEKLVKDFNAHSSTVEVVSKYNPDMYKGLLQNLQAESATGKSPALVQVGWAFLDYFSNNFSYTEPQKIIDSYFPQDKNFIKDNFLPNVLDLAKNSKNSQVGIPYSLSTPVLYINKDILRQAGLDENGPKTWEELVTFSNTIKEKTGKYGFYMQEPADNWATQALLESNGARMIKDGKAAFASEEGIKAYEAYADMVVKSKSALHISWDEGVKSFIAGNVGMLYTTIARRENIQKGAAFDVAAINSPAWTGKTKRLPAGGCFLAITAKTEKEQKAAWEFEKYLYSVESMAEWTKGTGYVPPRKDVATAENGLKKFLQENKMMTAATTQMDGVVSWTSFPGDAGLQAEQILLDTRDKILSGSVSSRDGLTSAQNKINALLKK